MLQRSYYKSSLTLLVCQACPVLQPVWIFRTGPASFHCSWQVDVTLQIVARDRSGPTPHWPSLPVTCLLNSSDAPWWSRGSNVGVWTPYESQSSHQNCKSLCQWGRWVVSLLIWDLKQNEETKMWFDVSKCASEMIKLYSKKNHHRKVEIL